MRIALLLSGEYRGNDEMVERHKSLLGEFDTYVACLPKYRREWEESAWKPKQIFLVPEIDFLNSDWSKYRNESRADESGFWQYYNLCHLLKNVPEYDFYIKSRNDLVIHSKMDFNFNALSDSTYYYSKNHFNGLQSHLNDQFWVASKKVIGVISKLVDDYYKNPDNVNGPKFNEGMLLRWLHQNGIATFGFSNLEYTKMHKGSNLPVGDSGLFTLERKKKKVVITGGAGFIGSHLTKRYVDSGYDVTVIDNLERGKASFLSDVIGRINFKTLDLTKYHEVKDCFVDIDIVIHLASKVGGIGTYLSKPYDVMNANIQMDSNVLRCVIENKIRKYFYASSAHIYPKELQTITDSPMIKESDAYPANPELTYGWAKLIGEIALESAYKQHNFLTIGIARFIGIYGPNQDFELESGSVIPVFSHRAIKYPEVPFKVWGTGKETRSYCYIDDALDCIEKMIEAMDTKSLVGPYNVGKGDRCTIEEIAKNVIEISGKDIKIEWDTIKNTVIWGQWCDCSLVKKELGWEAKTSLKDGLTIVYNNIKQRI